jgi:hypothetical protein
MEGKKKFKVCQRIFKTQEIEAIQNFVIKKLEVPDLFKVRDRFEGNQYLLNTLKKTFAFHTLFGHLGIPNYERIKLGFLNTFNIEEVIEKTIMYVEYENDLDNLNLDLNTIYIFVNINRKKCEIFAKELIVDELASKIGLSLVKFGDKIYN